MLPATVAAIIIAGPDVEATYHAAAIAYQTSIIDKAVQFKKSDLSGDTHEVVIKAASVACDREQASLVDATRA